MESWGVSETLGLLEVWGSWWLGEDALGQASSIISADQL